jgi:hypothetical protein
MEKLEGQTVLKSKRWGGGKKGKSRRVKKGNYAWEADKRSQTIICTWFLLGLLGKLCSESFLKRDHSGWIKVFCFFYVQKTSIF